MLTKVEVYTERGVMLSLPLGDSDSGYLVKDITGLDPNKASVISSAFALLDGEQYETIHGEKRNIVMTLGYDQSLTSSIRDRRNYLYAYLMPKSLVTLMFYIDDFPVVEIQGRVESFDGTMFVQDPQAIVSIVCLDPAFYSQDVYLVDSMTTMAVDTSVDASLSADANVVSYQGTIENGFTFNMLMDRDCTGFAINHNFMNGFGQTMVFDATLVDGGTLLADDLITISTVLGSKSAYLTRDDVVTSVLYGITTDSDWVTLYPGDNALVVSANGMIETIDPEIGIVITGAIEYTLEYKEKYGGL